MWFCQNSSPSKIASTQSFSKNLTQLRKAFPSKHEEDLVGVDFMKNEEYLLCSDTVKTILWNMEKTTIPYMVADLQKTKRIEDVKENINCIKAHPQSDSLFAYGTNRGLLALSDMRTSGK